MTLHQLAQIEPAPIDLTHTIKLYEFLERLKQYEGYHLLCMDVTINHRQKTFDSITFHRFDFSRDRRHVHVLELAAINTALLTLFNSFYLLHQQRKKKDRQSFTPLYWMQILDERYHVFGEIRKRKLRAIIE